MRRMTMFLLLFSMMVFTSAYTDQNMSSSDNSTAEYDGTNDVNREEDGSTYDNSTAEYDGTNDVNREEDRSAYGNSTAEYDGTNDVNREEDGSTYDNSTAEYDGTNEVNREKDGSTYDNSTAEYDGTNVASSDNTTTESDDENGADREEDESISGFTTAEDHHTDTFIDGYVGTPNTPGSRIRGLTRENGHVGVSGSSTVRASITLPEPKQCSVSVTAQAGTQQNGVFISYNNEHNTSAMIQYVSGICRIIEQFCNKTRMNVTTTMCNNVCMAWKNTTINSSCDNPPCRTSICNTTCHEPCGIEGYSCNCTDSGSTTPSSDTHSHSELCAIVVNLCGTQHFTTEPDGASRCSTCCNTPMAKLDSTGGENCITNKTNYTCNCENHTTTVIPSRRYVTGSTGPTTTNIPSSTYVTGTIPSTTESTEITTEEQLSRADNKKSSTYTIIVLIPVLVVVVVVVVIGVVIIRRKRICCHSKGKANKPETAHSIEKTNIYRNMDMTNRASTNIHVYEEIELNNLNEIRTISRKTSDKTSIEEQPAEINAASLLDRSDEKSLDQIPNFGPKLKRNSSQIPNNVYDTISVNDELDNRNKQTIETISTEIMDHQYCSLKRLGNRNEPQYEDIRINRVNQTFSNLGADADDVMEVVGHKSSKSHINNTKSDERTSAGNATYFILEQSESVGPLDTNTPYQTDLDDSVKTFPDKDEDDGDTVTMFRSKNQIPSDQIYYVLEKNDIAHPSEEQCRPAETDTFLHGSSDDPHYFVLEKGDVAHSNEKQCVRKPETNTFVHGSSDDPQYFVLEKSGTEDPCEKQCVRQPALAEKYINDIPNVPEYFVLEKTQTALCDSKEHAKDDKKIRNRFNEPQKYALDECKPKHSSDGAVETTDSRDISEKGQDDDPIHGQELSSNSKDGATIEQECYTLEKEAISDFSIA